jgi:peroxiredoxin
MLSAALVLAAAVMACAQPAAKTAEAVAAPDFSVKDLQGNVRTLADYKGKVLVVNFWATWCPPCRREIPDLIAAYQELKSEGLEILGISVDTDLAPPDVLAWTKKVGINYPVAMATREIVTAYEPGDYIPATIIVDRKGRIRFRQSELMTKDALVRLFKQFQ